MEQPRGQLTGRTSLSISLFTLASAARKLQRVVHGKCHTPLGARKCCQNRWMIPGSIAAFIAIAWRTFIASWRAKRPASAAYHCEFKAKGQLPSVEEIVLVPPGGPDVLRATRYSAQYQWLVAPFSCRPTLQACYWYNSSQLGLHARWGRQHRCRLPYNGLQEVVNHCARLCVMEVLTSEHHYLGPTLFTSSSQQDFLVDAMALSSASWEVRFHQGVDNAVSHAPCHIL
eukprot:5461789-Amphidinium_carterae.1